MSFQAILEASEGIEITIEANSVSEKGQEKEKKDDGKSGGNKDKNDGWSKEQDENILKMKGENKTWKEICEVVKATKKEVQERYKELQGTKKGTGAASAN